jgi:formylglycine-generating enzyme required for sulfatase activity
MKTKIVNGHEMIWIPPGTVTIEGKMYEVAGYWCCRFPTTVRQYAAFLGATGGKCSPKCDHPASITSHVPSEWEEQTKHLDRPVVWQNFYDARAYCAWAGLRLPTEAEWQLAAAGQEGRLYPWGNEEPTAEHAAFYPHSKGPEDVGTHPKGATPEGVEDMAGNVWEWTERVE